MGIEQAYTLHSYCIRFDNAFILFNFKIVLTVFCFHLCLPFNLQALFLLTDPLVFHLNFACYMCYFQVVHPAPGNANGTLVNAILHHCRLPIRAFANNIQISDTEECSESSDSDTEEVCADQSSMEEVGVENYEALVRPGIVHRLDKGTSGLLVVAKVSSNFWRYMIVVC